MKYRIMKSVHGRAESIFVQRRFLGIWWDVQEGSEEYSSRRYFEGIEDARQYITYQKTKWHQEVVEVL